jgi:PLP dependent protein
VRIVAVTKGFPRAAVSAALANGLLDVGENYAQELLAKAPDPGAGGSGEALETGSAPPSPRWHFLGAVQRNKVRRLAPLVHLWQGVVRVVEAAEISRHRPGARILVEVDTTGDPGRRGCPLGEVPALVDAIRELDVDLRGLMTVAPIDGDARGCFEAVGALADRLGLPERSMGMSDDMEYAVAAGSTMVRLGRALFGPGRRSPFPPVG